MLSLGGKIWFWIEDRILDIWCSSNKEYPDADEGISTPPYLPSSNRKSGQEDTKVNSQFFYFVFQFHLE